MHLPKTECGFHQFRHSKKWFVWVFFRQVLLSLPKLAVKNNSSKKHAQMWAKNTQMVDFLAQGTWNAAESGKFRCFRCAYIYTCGLDYSISHSTSQYPICVKNNSIKNMNGVFLAQGRWGTILSGSSHPSDPISMFVYCQTCLLLE